MFTGKNERGTALIMVLLFMAFLAILGGALITTSTIDVWISDNYRTATQLLYLTEAGIEQARENLRASPNTPSQLLFNAAGADGVISVSTDLNTLLSADVPFIGSTSLTDPAGRAAGRYFVFLRNDTADGMSSTADTNQVLNFLAFGLIGSSRKLIEATVMKSRFPPLPTALTLDGAAAFSRANSDFSVGGIGVTSEADRTSVLAVIPDVRNVESELDPRLKTPAGMEALVSKIAALATETYSPGYPGSASLGNVGSATERRIVVVNGDCTLGPGAGYGILVVRGNATFAGSFEWHGLVLVIGQGSFVWNADATGQINGGVFLARTRDANRDTANPMGQMLGTRGAVDASFDGGGANAIQLNQAEIDAASGPFPYNVIAIRER